MTMVDEQALAHELFAGRYRLVEVLHRSKGHVCWYGEDRTTRRPRLVTRTGLPAGAGPKDARRITARVLRASETMALLRPGRVARVVDAGAGADALWTVVEWVDGTPLGELLDQEGPLPPLRAARIGLGLLDVLASAHAEGITHGELGPGQVYVRDGGHVVVTGFGLAGATGAARLTAPSYAAPEQARGERFGPAADLWALGALLHHMVEGRPPFRDRGRPEATLRGVERLPPRGPLRAGPLTPVVRGLLRKDCLERLPRPVARDALVRVLSENTAPIADDDARPREAGAYASVLRRAGRARGRGAYPPVLRRAGRLRGRGAYPPVLRRAGRLRGRRPLAAGAVLAVVAVVLAGLTAVHRLPGVSGTAAAPPSRTATAAAPGAGTAGGAPRSPAAPTGAPSAPAAVPPAGYRRYDAPEGFSVALPAGWRRLSTSRAADRGYRVVFGAAGDARTLAVTHSERLGADPVAVWRDDVEPDLERQPGYRRIGTVRATAYQGRPAADMEWLSDAGGRTLRTFGRGLLLGGRRGFSLRWTVPADAFGTAANRRVLDVLLRTFRPAAG
ncbi:serine/threonine-protein kinase [Streptomyces sp. NPDC018610]|uniref:serine/threonine-protein kinase n=1 Tax=Streptomyces sp. NPDC018610 TaxID=3365049 RepID=UPI00379C9F01